MKYGKKSKKVEKVEKWPLKHYLATLPSAVIFLWFFMIFLFFGNFTIYKVIGGFSNSWYQNIKKIEYFSKNIPTTIGEGGNDKK